MSNPEDRLPSPGIRVLAAVGAVVLLAGAIVLSHSQTASAAGLEAFGSCAELEQHLAGASRDFYATGGAATGDVAEDDASGAPGAPAPATTAAGQGREESGLAGGDDGTNVQVAGVDELDVVELLADGRSLVARDDRVLLVAADGREVLASLPTPAGPQLSFDEERGVLWVVGADDWQTTTLLRVPVGGDGFGAPATWSVAGRLVDLRRAGATVHLVAVDDEVLPIEPGPASAGAAEDAALPFSGTSPVPCDEVLHSPLPGGPATTLVARFSADADLAPTAATEIVGAGDNVLVTDDAVYVSTPVFDGDRALTGIHRFDAGGLALTGSGSVEGRLLNQFALDEHGGHLRAAVTVGGGFFGGPMPMPMPVDDVGGPAVDPAVGGDVEAEAAGEVVRASIVPIQDTTGTTQPEPPTSESTTSTTEGPTTTTTVEPTTTTTEPTTTTESTTTTEGPVTTVPPQPGDALNEIVVLDLEGSLDVVGRSPRFGHPGETLHGIRFAGDVAYAVTFLQTDPFYVVDLTDPQAPRVLGELEIPGFSAYLHPISATQVVGFGPGPEGGVLARLFDVSDPAVPRLLDTVRIADDSPIVYDHHALRTDGGRLVVAANDWVAEPPTRCAEVDGSEAELEALFRELDTAYAELEQAGGGALPPDVEALERRINELSECVYPGGSPRARIVTLDPGAGRLGVTSTLTGAGEAQRILPLTDGGYLVAGAEVTRVSATGAIEATLS